MTRVPAAILILGARVLPSGRPSSSLARRIAAGVEAAHTWPSARLVACGGRAWDGVVEADVIARELVAAGVDQARIDRDRLSFNTRENLREGSLRARERGLAGALAVVTCDWHLPRALAIASSLGVDAMGVPARPPHGRSTRGVVRDVRERLVLILDRVAILFARSA